MTRALIPQQYGLLIHGSDQCTVIEKSLAENGQKPHYRTMECPDCCGEGESRKWGYDDYSRGWCHDCSGTGRVLVLVAYTPNQAKSAELSFDEIEECFPEGATSDAGYIQVSAQWLHDFARAVVKAVHKITQGDKS